MKDAKGHGSAAHQAGVNRATDQRALLASRAAASAHRYAEAQAKLKADPSNEWLANNIGVLWKGMMTDELHYAQKFEPERAKEIAQLFDKIEGR